MEAAPGAELKYLRMTEVALEKDYAAFLAADGSLHRLDAIGAGKDKLLVSGSASALNWTSRGPTLARLGVSTRIAECVSALRDQFLIVDGCRLVCWICIVVKAIGVIEEGPDFSDVGLL